MNAVSLSDLSADETPSTPRAGLTIAWAIFWMLLATVAVQDYLRQGGTQLWKPLLWEGSSFVVATVVVWSQWRWVYRLDRLLARPWRWFAASLVWLPLAAPVFVALVYALRHGVYALLGETYLHPPWGTVFGYEIVKFSMFYLLFVAIFFGIRSHAAMSNARVRAEHERALAQRAQLLQLAQQIEPHFLFNALNTIAATIHSDPDLADSLLTRLASLLRAATDLARRPFTTLDEELRLLDGYAAIMRERFADRVSLRFEIDPAARACRVPSLALQPLLENAFRHGVERCSRPATIVVRARRDNGRLRIAVEDDAGVLAGAPSDNPLDDDGGSSSGQGTGLTNLRQRLAAAYGERASLDLKARDGGGVIASIELPCEC